MPSLEEIAMGNKDIALRLFGELDKNNPRIFEELCAVDARIYMPGRSESYTVKEIVELVSLFYDALPDYKHTIEDVIAEADNFLAEYDWTDWNSLDKEQRRVVMQWKSMTEMFNEGEIGPGHCGDDDE